MSEKEMLGWEIPRKRIWNKFYFEEYSDALRRNADMKPYFLFFFFFIRCWPPWEHLWQQLSLLSCFPNQMGFFWVQYLRPAWDYIDSDFLIKRYCLLDIGKDLLIQLKFNFSQFFLQILLFTTQQVYYLLFYKYVIYPSTNLLVTSSWFQITSTHSRILM